MKKLLQTTALSIALSLTLPLTLTAAEDFSEEEKEINIEEGVNVIDIFGMEKGYIHPFMSVELNYSDNIYFTNRNTLSDWQVIYSPGIWLALPAQKEVFLDLDTSNTSPGGHTQQINKEEGFERYQAYVLYVADIIEYNDYSERNTVNQSAEAFFQLNLRSGLSFDIFDKFSDSEDAAGTGATTTIDEYKSNLAGIIADYQITDKIRVRADYNHYNLSYDDDLNQFRDRTDQVYSLFSFFDYSEKTSFFAQYKYIDVDYDYYDIQDSDQHYIYAGIKWSPTIKLTIEGKAGWLGRESDAPDGDSSQLVLDLAANWQITAKSQLGIAVAYNADESTISSAAFSKDTTASIVFEQYFTEKLIGEIYVDYRQTDFQGGTGTNRTDDTYTISPSIKYLFKEWLTGEVGYIWTDRDSSAAGYDYTANSFFIRISAGI